MNHRSRRLLLMLVALATLLVAPAGTLARKPADSGATADAWVFLPNPVASSGNQALLDNKDADSAALDDELMPVVLTNLDGSGYLNGDWASVRSSTGPLAFETDESFLYTRSDDRFEQVMAYYWVTEAQLYLQSLGFGSTLRPINMESQDVRINTWGADNSYSWDKHDVLRFGKGGVDDAEDADVILHEYGHAIHDSQVAGFGVGSEAGAIGEGFGDYWAVTVSLVVAGMPVAPAACVADWDSISYTSTTPHCLRRVDTNLKYGDLDGRVHHDGQVWSRALWDIRNTLGSTIADRIILEAQFDFAADTTMADAALATVAAANTLYGAGAAAAVQATFEARDIL
ncbi:MAG TPA: M36 family metallopeptidase [Candidatus Limnocylindria bacterium]|nr:M36 family metallopeptidase [Candidatus Limnocylindria bacterium]